MDKQQQTIVARLDEQYEEVLAAARLLSRSYVEAAVNLFKKRFIFWLSFRFC